MLRAASQWRLALADAISLRKLAPDASRPGASRGPRVTDRTVQTLLIGPAAMLRDAHERDDVTTTLDRRLFLLSGAAGLAASAIPAAARAAGKRTLPPRRRHAILRGMDIFEDDAPTTPGSAGLVPRLFVRKERCGHVGKK